MNATIKSAIGLCVILALTLGLVSSAVAAPAGAGGPPVLSKIAFVHYADAAPARDAAPAKPAKSAKEWYKYSGIHWADFDIPVHYRVDGHGNDAWLGGLQASLATWEADDQSYISFVCDPALLEGIPSSFDGGGYSNSVNEVGWASLSSSYPNAIAVTMIWYGRDKHIVEVDTAMNTDLPWTQNSVTGDPDMQTGTPGYFDVQDIMTHEAGHWLMLGDLYVKAASEQTMYGYGSTGELKARSLESGDLAGLRKIYPGADEP
jgi:hypothetical protein